MEELFKNKEYCFKEIGRARAIFSSKKDFTSDKAKPMLKALGIMYCYCPEEIQDVVLVTMKEVQIRASYL